MQSLFEVNTQINFEEFSKSWPKEARTVADVLKKYNFDLRIVGGAVRDFVRNVTPRDIDFATNAEPAELIFIFDIEKIEYDADGIQHGTIKAVFGDNKVDVTSIVYKMKIQNDHVKIDRNTSWKIDAENRDLTVNALSVDFDGTLYDYVGGIDDIKNQVVRFCPNPIPKIKRDPNQLLRWYKAIGLFENPKWPKKDRDLVQKYLPLLRNIKDEKRTKLELAGFLSMKNSRLVLSLMCKMGADKYLDLNCS
jgi:tRNA nucleotidyltransferase/poly(A) polymerase